MANSRYEGQLLIELKASLIANFKCNQFLENTNLQEELIDRIAIELTQSRYMAISEARSYIDGRTGRFRPGRSLIVCPSAQAGLYNQLERVTAEINNSPWKTKEQAIHEVAEKQQKVKRTLDLIKSELGVEGAKEVLSRVMNLARAQTGIR